MWLVAGEDAKQKKFVDWGGKKPQQVCARMIRKQIKCAKKTPTVSWQKLWNGVILKTLSVIYNVGTKNVHSAFIKKWSRDIAERNCVVIWSSLCACSCAVYKRKCSKQSEEAEQNIGVLMEVLWPAVKLCIQETISSWQTTVDKLSNFLRNWFPKKINLVYAFFAVLSHKKYVRP